MMASRPPRFDSMDSPHMRGGRSASFSSDVMSNSAKSTPANNIVPAANPPAGYIAQTEASDLLSVELDRKVVVSEPALSLLNDFLDHVLFSIIATSHSVQLGPLRNAVPAVLKPRLGKAALRVAEEELKEYMEDEEAEELYSGQHALQPKTDFDVELVWKMARLRCMVYARMGDLEEEDEEEWLEKEHLLEQAVASPISVRQSMAVTPGSAIFLTSIIEYLGEQALYYAAQYAQKRHDNTRGESSSTSPESQLDARHSDILLEGKDMNHVGRDSPLSRLWRSWRRNTRSPGDASRPMSPESFLSPTADSIHSRATSNYIDPIMEEHRIPDIPSQIPLPISEIDEDEFVEGKRPLSMPTLPGKYPESITSQTSPRQSWQDRPRYQRQRSNSVPVQTTPFVNIHTTDRDSFSLPIQGATSQHDGQEAIVNQPTVYQQVTVDEKPEEALPTRPRTAHAERQLNATVGTLATALGAVGVHQIRDLPSSNTQTSPSIKSPEDLDMTYAQVDGELTPRPVKPQVDTQPVNQEYRYGLNVKSYEDHRRYSANSYDMETPSIYSHKDYSPRIAQEARPDSQESKSPQSAHHPSSPDHIRASNDRVRALSPQIGRPSSATSSTGKRPISQEPVQQPIDEYVMQNTVSHSKSSSSSSRLLGFTRDSAGRPQTISQQRAAGDMSDLVRRAHSSTPNGSSSPPISNLDEITL